MFVYESTYLHIHTHTHTLTHTHRERSNSVLTQYLLIERLESAEAALLEAFTDATSTQSEQSPAGKIDEYIGSRSAKTLETSATTDRAERAHGSTSDDEEYGDDPDFDPSPSSSDPSDMHVVRESSSRQSSSASSAIRTTPHYPARRESGRDKGRDRDRDRNRSKSYEGYTEKDSNYLTTENDDGSLNLSSAAVVERAASQRSKDRTRDSVKTHMSQPKFGDAPALPFYLVNETSPDFVYFCRCAIIPRY